MEPFCMKVLVPSGLRTSHLLQMNQKAAAAHLHALGLTGAAETRGFVWLVIRTRFEIYAPVAGEVTLQTWPAPSRGGMMPRHLQILGTDGALLAQAVTIWALADIKSRTFIRHQIFSLPEMTTGAELPYPKNLPRRPLPTAGSFVPQPEWIDENGHMNNTCYPLAAEQVLGLDRLPQALTVDYRAEILPRTQIMLHAAWEGSCLHISGTAGQKDHFRLLLEYPPEQESLL